VPPKIQLFLWLMSNNKLATVDNLNKKGMNKPSYCRFCDEESIRHLFFEFVVARRIWDYALGSSLTWGTWVWNIFQLLRSGCM
jgi:hypothetical protein